MAEDTLNALETTIQVDKIEKEKHGSTSNTKVYPIALNTPPEPLKQHRKRKQNKISNGISFGYL